MAQELDEIPGEEAARGVIQEPDAIRNAAAAAADIAALEPGATRYAAEVDNSGAVPAPGEIQAVAEADSSDGARVLDAAAGKSGAAQNAAAVGTDFATPVHLALRVFPAAHCGNPGVHRPRRSRLERRLAHLPRRPAVRHDAQGAAAAPTQHAGVAHGWR